MTDLVINIDDLRVQRGSGDPGTLPEGRLDVDETNSILRAGTQAGTNVVWRDQGYVDAGDAATLASAQTYADTGDAATLAEAQAYADAAVAAGGGGPNGLTFPITIDCGIDDAP